MKFYKIFVFFCLFFLLLALNLKATTLGPIDFIGYPSQGPALDTLKNAMNYFSDPTDDVIKQQFFMKDNFYDLGLVYSLKIFKDKPPVHYKLWIHHKPSKLISIVPGMGSHYLNQTLMYLAYTFYKAGYSVMVISSTFNWDFMEGASTTPVPGFPIRDAKDTYYALYKIINHLQKKYGKTRLTENILVGYSMGGLQTLIISELEKRYDLINFSRIVAINPPIDLLFGMKKLDKFFTIINSWPKPVLREKVYKALRLFNDLINGKIGPDTDIPLENDEAKYIVGYINHSTIVDMIASIHKRGGADNIIFNKYKWYNQEEMYREIENYNFHKYIRFFVLPYYSKLYGNRFSLTDMNDLGSIKYLENNFKNNEKLRIIHNQNDFLLKDSDQKWLWDTFDDNVIFFTHGGHLGNMFYPEVVKYILQAVNTDVKGGFKLITVEAEPTTGKNIQNNKV